MTGLFSRIALTLLTFQIVVFFGLAAPVHFQRPLRLEPSASAHHVHHDHHRHGGPTELADGEDGSGASAHLPCHACRPDGAILPPPPAIIQSAYPRFLAVAYGPHDELRFHERHPLLSWPRAPPMTA